MKIFITGNKGYIAENLQKHLLKNINEKYVLTGCDKVHYNERIEMLYDIDADIIIHTAAVPGVDNCNKNPDEAILTNIIGSNNVFSIAAQKNIPVVVLSTQGAKEPSKSTYALTKRAMELDFQNRLGSCGIIMRLSNVYGGDNFIRKKDTLVSRFMKALKTDTPVYLYGTGECKRDFIHVADVCRAIHMAIIKITNDKLTFASTPIIDICTGKETSIIDAARNFGVKFELKPLLKTISVPKAMPEMAKKIIGFEAIFFNVNLS